MDYDDLLVQWARLIDEFPDQRAAQGRMFRHILIDEMQDTNTVQVDLVEAIAAAGAGNLTAVGDDAQSIYRFRGANYDNILKFPERHPGRPHLPARDELPLDARDRRASPSLDRAQQLGFAKTLVSARTTGPLPVVQPTADAYEEADFVCQQILEIHEEGIALGRMAVLYRNHHDSILLQAELVQRGITYEVRSGLRFFEQAHIKDVLAYLRIVVNPRDEAAWRRLLLLLPGIGPAKAAAVCGAPAGRRRAAGHARRGLDDGAGAGQEQRAVRRVRRRPPEDPGSEARDRARRPRSRRSSRAAIRRPSGASTNSPRTGSPTSSSSASWPRATTASSG